MSAERERRLAERVRAACIAAAREGHESAAASGLCAAGAWEAALGAMQMLDLTPLVADQGGNDGDTGPGQAGV